MVRCERTRAKPMLEGASDVLVVVDAASSRGFPADGLRTFMRDFPEQTFHVLVALESPDAAVDEAVADVAMAATGSVFYVAPPGEDEVGAPAPAPPEKDRAGGMANEGQLADGGRFDLVAEGHFAVASGRGGYSSPRMIPGGARRRISSPRPESATI